jgi:hypothetical protein
LERGWDWRGNDILGRLAISLKTKKNEAKMRRNVAVLFLPATVDAISSQELEMRGIGKEERRRGSHG